MKYFFLLIWFSITAGGPLPTQAGESLFSRVYTTETVPAHHWETEEILRDRNHRSFGSYNAVDSKTEFEYGVTDNFQGALYINAGYIDAIGAPDDNDPNGSTGFTRSGFFFEGIATEFIYRALSPISDAVGLAFYFEPEMTFHDLHDGLPENYSFSNEFRILFQKNFLEDQLILVYNVVLETEFFRYGDRDTAYIGELDWNNELGLTYRTAANIYTGIEFRNHNEVGNFYSHDHSVYWLGPSIHYGGPRLWANFGLLAQVYGDPNGTDGNGSFLGGGLFLHSHEQWETTLKVGLPF